MTVKQMIDNPDFNTAAFWNNPANIDDCHIEHRIFNGKAEVRNIRLLHFIKPQGVISVWISSQGYGELKVVSDIHMAEKDIEGLVAQNIFQCHVDKKFIQSLIIAQTKGVKPTEMDKRR